MRENWEGEKGKSINALTSIACSHDNFLLIKWVCFLLTKFNSLILSV